MAIIKLTPRSKAQAKTASPENKRIGMPSNATTVRAATRLEHVNCTTAQGDVRWHFIRRVDANIDGACHDINWWRVRNPRNGLLHKLVDAFKRMLRMP